MNRFLLSAATLALTSTVAVSASAQVWDGETNTLWGTATNWNVDAVPAADGIVTIDSGALGNQPTLDVASASLVSVGVASGTLTIDNVLTVANGLTLSGSGNATIAIGSSVVGNVTAGGSGTLSNSGTINGQLRLTGATANNAGAVTGETLVNGGTLNLNAGSNLSDTQNLLVNSGTVNVNVAETVGSLLGLGGTINLGATLTAGGDVLGTIYQGQITGTGGLTKAGIRPLILVGNNTYSGTTTITNGTLQIGLGGNTGSIGTGNIVNNSTLAINRGDGFLQMANVISGTGSVNVIMGPSFGELLLTGNNSFTGDLWVQQGQVTLGNDNAAGTGPGRIRLNDDTVLRSGAPLLTISKSILIESGIATIDVGGEGEGPNDGERNVLILDGTISEGEVGGLVVSGNSFDVLILTGENGYSGGTTVLQGLTVAVGDDDALGSGSLTLENDAKLANVGGFITLANSIQTNGNGLIDAGEAGDTLVLNGRITGAGSISSVGAGNLVLNASTSSFGDIGVNSGKLTLSGVWTCNDCTLALNNNATLGAGGPGAASDFAQWSAPVITTGNGLVDVVAGGSLTLAGGVSGAGSISNVGPGRLVLTGDSSFTGGLGVNAGTVMLLNSEAAGAGDIAIGNATLATFGVEGVEGGNNIVLGNLVVTTGNAIIDVYGQDGLNDIMTLNGTVAGPGSISKTGEGFLVLNGDNSFVNLGINQGTVVVGSDTAAGVGDIAINNNATLSIRVPTPYVLGGGEGEGEFGVEVTLLSLVPPDVVIPGTIITLANGITTTGNGLVDAGDEGDRLILNGNISGPGSISQIGNGNLILNGDNSFRNLGINAGTVTLGTNTAAGIGNIAINNNATLAAGADGLVIANRVFTTGNGIVNAGPAGTYFVLNGVIAGTGSISQVGEGNLVLNDFNTFSGGLGINAGRVTIGFFGAAGTGDIALNDNATLAAGGPGARLNSGVIGNNIFSTGNGLVDVADGARLDLVGTISGPGSISKTGTGSLYLYGDNTFVNLGINEGTVVLRGNNAAGVGSIALNNNATLAGDYEDIVIANGIITTGNGIIDVYADPPGDCCGYYGILTLNGNIAGPGSISKTGDGYLVLNGDNSFVNLGINQGTVVVGSNTAAGAGEIAINNNATLSIRMPTPWDSGEGEGDMELSLLEIEPMEAEPVTITLDNAITTTANGLVDAGNLGDTFILNGDINGDGSISQIGTGNLVLNGDNSFINLGINAGTVTLGTDTAAGAGFIAINNDATLAAGANNLVIANDITTTANGIVDAGPAGNVFTLNGDINGDGSISQVGAGNLVLNGDNSFNNLGINQGTVTLGSNTAGGAANIAINNNATLAAGKTGLVVANAIQTTGNGTINSGSGIFTLTGPITDVGGLIKTGSGTLILTGTNSYTGNTTVAQGTLRVNGNTGNTAVFVNTGATIGGTGTVGALTVRTGGTVAPGNSIGALAVNGAYVQQAGGTYAVELGTSGIGDRINVAGTATLASGAIANVINTSGARFALGSRWTILTSGLGRTGTFTLTGATRVSQFISVFATYDANNAYLNVAQTSSFASVADTPNQLAAATGVDRAGNGAVYEAIAYLPNAAAAQDAFDQVSGEIHASLLGASFEDSRFVREAIYNHTADKFLPGMGLWVAGFGSWGAAQADGNAARLDRSIGGFFLGFDALKTDTASVGVLTGYSTADINVPDRNSFASTDDLYVGLYGNYDVAGFTLTGAITNTWRWVGTRRAMAFEGFQESVQANYLINTFQVFGEAGYQFDFGGFGVKPFASFAYVNVDGDGFTEKWGSASLTADDSGGSDYWTTLLGLKASYGLPIAGNNFAITASGGWRYVFEGETVPERTMRFQSGPAFTVFGAPIAQNAFAASFSVQTKLTDRADIDFGYSGQYGDGWNDSGVRASLRLRF